MIHHTGSPGTPQEALYRRTDISPEVFFQTLGRVRRTVRDEIERLIEWLDNTIDCDEDSAIDDNPCDGDPDLEPSLGSFECMSNQVRAWQTRTLAEVDAELDRCDDEPSLCGLTANALGRFASADLEADVTDKPHDEVDEGGSGIGDMDGLHEQDCVSRHFATVE